MDHFNYHNGELHAEDISLVSVANEFGTPCFVYSKAAIKESFLAYENALAEFPHLICYAVKANSNLSVLRLLARLGAGFDIVSGGELQRVLQAGGDPAKVIFSGVGKTRAEIEVALRTGIQCFNVETDQELNRINSIASDLKVVAPVSLRVNPDVDAGTHPYISTGLKENKFGIDSSHALEVYQQAATLQHVKIIGIDCHIGSQLTEVAPYLDALDRVLALVDELSSSGIDLEHIDLGGGLGVVYRDETPPATADLVKQLLAKLSGRSLRLLLEPGRSIVANAGLLLVTVEYLKQSPHKNFAIVDGAMNDLLRPSLYGAWQEIVPVKEKPEAATITCDIVGPVCESADFLGKDRKLAVQAGDLLAVRSAGAYGFSMSSNYNSRNRAAEIMVDGGKTNIIRRRESFEDQIRLEMPVSR
jgi:diaminopimelate decarboxylase